MAESSPDVDYRYVLANERTFLAWMRTSLGIIAGGVALDQLARFDSQGSVPVWIAIGIVCLGVAVAVTGTLRWSRADTTMRSGGQMRRSRGIPIVGIAVAVVAAVLAVVLWVQR